MTKLPSEHLGLLPSLEVLPFFLDEGPGKNEEGKFPFQMKAYSSYGEIARNMLTRKLVGGIVPWEIFITDVLALPGQKTAWKVPLFLQACPTELVMREPVFKTFHPTQAKQRAKLPARLVVGVESQNSLTKLQALEWLAHWKNSGQIDLQFKMLPVEMMMQALEAEALDVVIAPAPWGLIAENQGLGKRDPRFMPGKFAQQLVLVCHREFVQSHPDLAVSLSRLLKANRLRLSDPQLFQRAATALSTCSRSSVLPAVLEQSAELHSFADLGDDLIADETKLTAELAALDAFSALPSQVAANEPTARLLLPEFSD